MVNADGSEHVDGKGIIAGCFSFRRMHEIPPRHVQVCVLQINAYLPAILTTLILFDDPDMYL